MFIRSSQKTLLQIILKVILNFQVIVKIIKDPDKNFKNKLLSMNAGDGHSPEEKKLTDNCVMFFSQLLCRHWNKTIKTEWFRKSSNT